MAKDKSTAKTDALRKQREAQFERAQQEAKASLGEGVCTGCNKKRATRDGLIINHSWPSPTRQVCPGAGKAPR